MTTTEIALLSTCIGAGAGIFSQIISNTLRDITDKKKVIIDIISEERKLAQMLALNAIGIRLNKISSEYNYQLCHVFLNTKHEDASLERHYEAQKIHQNLIDKHSVLLGDYCKNIHKLILNIGHGEELFETLDKILLYELGHDITFKDYITYEDLYSAYSRENKKASKELEPYAELFKKMHRDMIEAKNNSDDDD